MDSAGDPPQQQHGSGQVCRICGDGVGSIADGGLFVACAVCAFPVCRPCYDYERKDGNQSCPQCKTKYKRHKGSRPIHGEEVDVDDDIADFHYTSGEQDQKHKLGEMPSAASPDHMMSPGGEGKPMHPLSYQSPNQSREFSVGSYGNVAWKERVDGWKMKHDKIVHPPMSNGGATYAPSEGRGATDDEAATEYMDDSLLCSNCEKPL